MATLQGRSRMLMNLASKARSASRCGKSHTSLASDRTVASASRSVPSPCSEASPTNFSATSLGGNQRLSAILLRVPREVACMQSLLPLYTVTASSRLVSQLSKNTGATLANLHGTQTHMSPDR